MRSQHILRCFELRPIIPPSDAAVAANLVNVFYASHVFLILDNREFRVFEEERVLDVSRRMLLWDEKSVEIPKRCFHEVVRWHFFEPEFEHYLTELLTHF